MDRLDLAFINSLPQPLMARFFGGDEWPVHDIDVETGLIRIDVCGKLQIKDIVEVNYFRDSDGGKHDAYTFFLPNTENKGEEVAT